MAGSEIRPGPRTGRNDALPLSYASEDATGTRTPRPSALQAITDDPGARHLRRFPCRATPFILLAPPDAGEGVRTHGAPSEPALPLSYAPMLPPGGMDGAAGLEPATWRLTVDNRMAGARTPSPGPGEANAWMDVGVQRFRDDNRRPGARPDESGGRRTIAGRNGCQTATQRSDGDERGGGVGGPARSRDRPERDAAKCDVAARVSNSRSCNGSITDDPGARRRPSRSRGSVPLLHVARVVNAASGRRA